MEGLSADEAAAKTFFPKKTERAQIAGWRLPVSTVRPTIRPARKSSSAACASPSGRLRVGIGPMFLARAKSSSSRASASVPVSVPSMVIALMPNMAAAIKIAAEEPGHDDLAAARHQAGGELQRFVGANEIADRQQSAAGRAHHRLARLRIGRIIGLRGAGRERGITLLRIDIGDNRRRRKSARAMARPIMPTPPRPMSRTGPRSGRFV